MHGLLRGLLVRCGTDYLHGLLQKLIHRLTAAPCAALTAVLYHVAGTEWGGVLVLLEQRCSKLHSFDWQ